MRSSHRDVAGRDQHTESGGKRRDAGRSLGGRETRRIFRCRLFFAFLFVALTIGTASTVFRVTKSDDEDDFQQRFEDIADQVLMTSQIKAKMIFRSVESLSRRISIYAKANGQEWPMVIVPKFEAVFDQLRRQTGATAVSMAVTVTEQSKAAYENFQMLNGQKWIADTYEYLGMDATGSPFIPLIYALDFTTGSISFQQGQGVYAPLAQTAPLAGSTGFVNYDLLSNPLIKLGYDVVHLFNSSVLSQFINLGNATDDPEQWPQSSLIAPIFKDVPNSAKNVDDKADSVNIVALLMPNLPWHMHFTDTLPVGIDAVDLVIENTCNQSCTFQIEGPEVSYIGPGDHHDRTFSHLVRWAPFAPFQNRTQCKYTFHVYPTQDFKDAYMTNHPRDSVIVVVAVFVTAAVFFVVYDNLVARRQHKVLDSAARSGAIVSSLFPDTVLDRVLSSAEEVENEKTVSNHGNARKSTTGWRRKSMDKGPRAEETLDKTPQKQTHQSSNDIEDTAGPETAPTGAAAPATKSTSHAHISQSSRLGHSLTSLANVGPYMIESKSRPIADSFENVTILFANISGFKKWSSTRSPTDVFTLLETLYTEFDKLADEVGIFKVETIGECYVAACGLPEERDDHAVLLYRFCRLCVRRSRGLLLDLSTQLGGNTRILRLRCGMHSGSITAGVLRGAKSRFQLFGDTMNTAARMESSGLPGRIHLSEATADELIRKGKGKWLTPREDEVVAKGKGRMKTFWGSDDISCEL